MCVFIWSGWAILYWKCQRRTKASRHLQKKKSPIALTARYLDKLILSDGSTFHWKKKGKMKHGEGEREGERGDSYSDIDWVFKKKPMKVKEKGSKRFTKNERK